jgi:hypothetical protein
MPDGQEKPPESAPERPPIDPNEYSGWVNDKLRQAVDALIARNMRRGLEPRATAIGDPPKTDLGDPGAISSDADKAPPEERESC